MNKKEYLKPELEIVKFEINEEIADGSNGGWSYSGTLGGEEIWGD